MLYVVDRAVLSRKRRADDEELRGSRFKSRIRPQIQNAVEIPFSLLNDELISGNLVLQATRKLQN